MASVNRVFLIGNLGSDPELRHTANGTAVTTLSVATSDYRQQGDGDRQEHTEWHRVVVWNKQAELCVQYLAKGRPVFIEGRLATRSWEDAQGEKRYTTEVIANTVQFLGVRDFHLASEAESASGEKTSAHQVKPAVSGGGGSGKSSTYMRKSRSGSAAEAVTANASVADLDAQLGELPF